MIRLPQTQRAEITDSFKAAYRELNAKLFDKLQKDLESTPAYARGAIERAKKPQIARLHKLNHDAAEFDRAMTTLRTLEYAKFDTYTDRGLDFLWCQTKPAIGLAEAGKKSIYPPDWNEHSTRWQNQNWNQVKQEPVYRKYDLGVYWVFVPLVDILSGSLNRIHFIPEREKNTHLRHQHHFVRVEGEGRFYGPQNERGVRPLQAMPSTCWGNFPGVLTGCMSDGDIVELLRVLYLFVTNLNPGSPLIHFDDLPFWKEIR
jgi:hypothetical protein